MIITSGLKPRACMYELSRATPLCPKNMHQLLAVSNLAALTALQYRHLISHTSNTSFDQVSLASLHSSTLLKDGVCCAVSIWLVNCLQPLTSYHLICHPCIDVLPWLHIEGG